MDKKTRRFFESRFGYNFSKVRIHNDPVAHSAARNLQAEAYTIGPNIYFNSGAYNPDSAEGKKLLAHELTHVVQQTSPARSRDPQRQAVPLSTIPSPAIQRTFIATGDASGFAALANSIIAVQYEVVVSSAGEVSIRTTDVQGPPTPEAQELVNVLRTVINDSNATTIEFIHGATPANAAQRRVFVGAYATSQIDLDDVAAFGTQGSVGLGLGRTGGALLAHEITEQYRKQVHGEAYSVAHPAGVASESSAVGGTRGATSITRVNPSTLRVTIPYTYPDGTVVDVTWDIVNGNPTNIQRRVRP